MRTFLLSTTTILLLGSCAAQTVSALKIPTNPTTPTKSSSALLSIPRGGAGPLDAHANTVAKTALALGGIQGAFNLLCAEAVLEGYGWSTSNAQNVIAVKGAGFAALANTWMNYQYLVAGADSNTALCSGLAVHWIGGLAALINKDPAKTGTKASGVAAWLAIDSAVLYGLSKNADWATNYGIKAIAVLALLSGGLMAADPARGLQLYGRNAAAPPLSTETALMVEAHGAILSGGGAMMLAVASGIEATKVVGYAFIPFTLALIKSVFITKQYQKAGMDTAPFIGWIAMTAVFVGTLCF
ncbi:expressed unknown protein [Seminavis robusta]|uniref:Uncharacterized protein n=1 Tax=Seminavis robusta TaxID=568900 RepID=A0A9N8DEH3_9STRA|nr:expressed unknown protein [Seminavis robusta]|eukprot:Sro105_g053100.1 n/a (299) ;mRNA; r:17733-18629